MKKLLFPILLILTPVLVGAETVILYLQPTLRSPVIGTLQRSSEAFLNAQPVEDASNWKKVERKDVYNGFIARDSLDANGEVEIGTTVLLTPSSGGTVLLTVEEGDPVTINLVDRWTEITVEKAIPAYFRDTPPRSARERSTATATGSRILHSQDPLLSRVSSTRYQPESTASRGELTTSASRPVAATSTTSTVDPMTGFEDVERLNPATSVRAETTYETTSTTRSSSLDRSTESRSMTSRPVAPGADATSLSDPLSLSRIPAEFPGGTEAPEAPTQDEAVDRIQEEESAAIEGRSPDIVGQEVAESSPLLMDPILQEPIDMDSADNVEIIPLVPLTGSRPTRDASATASSEARAGVERGQLDAPVQEEGIIAETEVAEPTVAAETRATIIQPEENVEVAVDVEEAVLPGIPEVEIESVPTLRPATDINRTFVGQFRRTRSFLGIGPDYDFELVNSQNRRIAFVDISSIPMSSMDRFTNKIVRVHGTIQEASDGKHILINAVNINLR